MIAGPVFLRIALVYACVVLMRGIDAQTYSVGPDAPQNTKAPANAAQAPAQSMGWGSNIQNARLARAAELALQRGDHGLALDYAQRAAQAAPNEPQLWFLLGYAARLDGKLQISADAYARGLRLNNAAPDGISGLAQTYSMMGKNEDAERLLKQALTSGPGRGADALLLGDLYMRSANYTDAVEWLSRAERIEPSSRSELLMALCYQHLKQMDLADKYLRMARQRAPNNPEVQRSMAGYYRESGEYADAIAALKSIKNPSPEITAELAYTYQLDGKLEDSARVYAQAADAAPKNLDLQLSAAQGQVAIRSIQIADAYLQRAATIDANNYRLHAIRAEIAKAQGHDEVAVKEYNSALANLPAAPVEGPLYGIQLHMELSDLDKSLMNAVAAQHQLEIAQAEIQGLGNQPTNRPLFLRLSATIKMGLGDLSGALHDIKEALASNTHDLDDLQINGDVLMKLGHTEEAIAVYKQELALDADNLPALTSLGYASHIAGNDQDAEKYFHQLEQIDPTSYVPYLAIGDIYTSRREFIKAQDAYSKAYALAPQRSLTIAGGMNAAIEAHNLPQAAIWLARVTGDMQQEPQILREKERYLSFNGEYQASSVIGREAIKVLPHDRDVVVYLGYDYLHLDNYADLQELTTKYFNLFPKEPDIPLLEGYVQKHEGHLEQARQDFTEALNRDPNIVTAYVNRGYMLNDLHQPQAAATDFESALQREPNNGEAHLGLAYADLDLSKPQAALQQSELAKQAMGDSRNIHVIRATAYGRQDMLTKSATEYIAALKFTPNDGELHYGLGNTYFAQRKYHQAIDQLQIAEKESAEISNVDALLARSYAHLQDREQTEHYVKLAEQHVPPTQVSENSPSSAQSDLYVSTGEALSSIGDQRGAMERFEKALSVPGSDRVGVRLAIAQVMAQQGQSADAERQIALAQMEAEAGDTAAPSGNQLIAAADVFRSLHDYQLSQTYIQRAKAAGAPDTTVRIGMAENYLALGDTARAQAELSAVRATSDGSSDYQYLLAEANVYRQQHHDAQALTSFAQASNAEGEDQTAEQAMLQAGADEGLRITPVLSLLSEFSVEPIFEDTTVYVLDSKLDAAFPVPMNAVSLLPPPRSSIELESTTAFHLNLGHLPTASGFFQVRNSQGQISVPSTNSIVDRNTTDYTFNLGLNPTINLGNNVITFNSGVQGTIRRDSESPVAMDQNLFRVFTYMSTSSFFNAVSVSGYFLRETGPFTESNLSSTATSAAVDFRVGAPWGKTALVTGWGRNKQAFSPVSYQDYYTSSYIGIEHKFTQRLDLKIVAEDLRAWRVVGANSGIAQNLRPAGTIDFTPKHNWDVRVSSAYSSNRGFHIYDAIQNGVSVSYRMPLQRKFHDSSGPVDLQYPVRFSAGFQQETFFNFTGAKNQQFRPYVGISLF